MTCEHCGQVFSSVLDCMVHTIQVDEQNNQLQIDQLKEYLFTNLHMTPADLQDMFAKFRAA